MGRRHTPAEQWTELGPHLEKWAAQDLVVVDARSWDCPFNWKVIVENFMESYHHLGAHSQSLQPMMPARDTWTEAERAHYVRCHLPYGAKERGAIDEAQTAGKAREIFPLIPGLGERDRFEWGLSLGFPNWLLAYVPDCLIWYRLQPEGPHRHTLLTTLLVPRAVTQLPDFAGAAGPGHGGERGLSSRRHGDVYRRPTRLLLERLPAGPIEPPRNVHLAISAVSRGAGAGNLSHDGSPGRSSTASRLTKRGFFPCRQSSTGHRRFVGDRPRHCLAFRRGGCASSCRRPCADNR